VGKNFKDIFDSRKKIFLVGAMGGGKTEIAINCSIEWSLYLQSLVGLMDLDMVKPSFRLRSIAETFKKSNVELVLPDKKYRYADFPIISASMAAYVLDGDRPLVIDVGGDSVGARLAGRYRGRLNPDIVHFWYVYNGRRPFSRGEDEIGEMMYSIEKASGFKLTGLIHNTHLMGESTVDILAQNFEKAEQLAKKNSIPLRFHCIREDLFHKASNKFKNIPLLPLKLFIKPVWE